MADATEKRETGASLVFAGFSLLVADLLVLFFLPSAIVRGRDTIFFILMAGLAFVGLALMVKGFAMRGKSSRE